MRINLRNQGLLALTLIGLLMNGPEVAAQRSLGISASGHSSKVRVPDDMAREPLDVAKTALSGGDVDRALSVYQDILDRMADKLAATYRVPRSGTETDHILAGDRFSGIRDYIATLIHEIPDGLNRYREREGPRAAAELARALLGRDEGLLRGIVMRWQLTEAGPIALAALSDILFQTGRITEARLCADRLLSLEGDAAPKQEIKARATLRAAIAHAALQDVDELRALLAGLANGDAAQSVTWGGTTRALSEVVEQILASAKAPPRAEVEKSIASFAKPAWISQPFSRHAMDDMFDVQFKFGNGYMTPGSFYSVIPALSDSAVYYCDGLRVEGLSLLDGHPIWPRPVETPLVPPSFQGYRHWNLLHEVVLDHDVVYACLEDEPDIRGDRQHMIMGFKPIETIAVRKLYAIDANTGETLWTHASPGMARDADERAFLERISVNTPPLVLGDRLYVGATYYFGGFRQWLCAFERDTGRIAWRTYIGQGQAELNMFGNPVMEVVPGYVGEHNGLLVYSTNIGVFAAVDAITGIPKWVTAYDQEPVPSSDGQRTVGRAPGWTVARPLFYAGRAIIAPSDSLEIYLFNLENGEARAIPGGRRTRDTQFRHVVGIQDDALILAGRKIHAFDLKPVANGDLPTPKWEAPPDGALTGEAAIEGRPAFAGGKLFYVGRGSNFQRRATGAPGYIACIDVRTGRILEEKQIEGPLFRGNIVFSQDAIAVAGDGLTVMFDVKDVAKRLEAELKDNPDDAEAQLRLAQIELQAKNFDRAIAAFERARKLAASSGPRGESIQSVAGLALYNLILDLAGETVELQNLPASPKERFEKAFSYATTPRQQVQVLGREILWAKGGSKPAIVREIASRLMNEFPDERIRVDLEVAAAMPELARGAEMKAGLFAALVAASTLLEAEQLPEATAMYQQALARFPDDVIATSGGSTSVWRFAFLKIALIVKAKGAAAYAAEERAAEALLEEGRKSGNLDSFRALLDRYPNSQSVEPAWLELSRRLRESGRDREALRAVQRQLSRYGAVTAPLLSELARSLESAKAFESARDVLLTLKERFAKESIPSESGPVPVTRYVDERLATDAYKPLIGPPPLPEGAIGLKLAWTESPTSSGEEVVLVVPEGRRPAAADNFVLVHRDGELRAIEIESGRPKWSKSARSLGDPARPIWYDGRLFAVLDGDLVSLDPATGKENWRASASQMRVLAIHAAHGKAYMMLRSPLSARTVVVRALDLVSGEKLRDLESPLSAGFGGDQTYSSFGSSPLWLLCRLDMPSGSIVVLDGVTGDSVYFQASGSAFAMPAMLTANNLLVTQSISQPSGVRDVTIVARNPKTQQIVWNYKLERLNDKLNTVALTPQIGVFSARFQGTGQGRREIIALDLTNGTTRMSIGLRPTDIPQDGVVAGDILLVKFTTPDGKRFIRAYDLKKSALIWDSVTYTGTGLLLFVHPSKNYAVVRVSTRDPAAETRTDMVHFFENRTGLLKDSITLQNTLNRPDQADLDLRDKAIAIRGGAEVSVRR